MRRTQLVATLVAAAGVLCGVFAVTLIVSRCRCLPLPCVCGACARAASLWVP